MKRILIAGASVIALTCAAGAADLPPVEPVPVAMAPEFSWSGFYVGIHGGGAWGNSDTDSDLVDFGDIEGFVVGGHAGYLWQADSIVFGVEADGSFADLEDTFDGEEGAYSIEGDYLASFRGRLGFAFDRFLVYGTGGVAFTNLEIGFDAGDDDANFIGWVAGGGIEYAITDNISLGVEYLHYNFGDEVFAPGPEGTEIEADYDVDVVRGRLSVKFDSLFN